MDKIQPKKDRFERIAERRVIKVLDDLDSLGKCADRKNYDYSEEEVKKIFGALEKKTREIKALFQFTSGRSQKFTLRD
jgi:hypothetical protein